MRYNLSSKAICLPYEPSQQNIFRDHRKNCQQTHVEKAKAQAKSDPWDVKLNKCCLAHSFHLLTEDHIILSILAFNIDKLKFLSNFQSDSTLGSKKGFSSLEPCIDNVFEN